MTYNDLLKELFESLPEVREEFDKDLYSWQGEGCYAVYGTLLMPILNEELAKKVPDEDFLGRAFALFERMAVLGDESVKDVLYTTVLEMLGDDGKRLVRARALMGKTTRLMSQMVEEGLGRE